MATIAENLQIIKDSTDAIKQAIVDKGGSVDGDISTWASAINGIQAGGAVDNGFLGVATLTKPTVFGVSNFKKLIINDGVTEIAAYCLYRCGATEIILPNSVITVGQNAFYNCKKLTSIVLPDNITTIQTQCFYGCEVLKTIVLPENLTTINTGAFNGCKALKKVVFKSKIQRIDTNVFVGTDALEVLDFVACVNIPKLANVNAFSGIPSTCKIVVPDALYDSWIAATNWSTYASYIIKKSDYDAL